MELNRRIVVLGGGESGTGAAILAQKKGFDVWLSDMGSIAPKYKELLDRMIGLALKRERTEKNLTFTFDTNILNQSSFGGQKGSKL